MKLSAHLSVREVVKSNTAMRYGIDNTPTSEHLDNLELIAKQVFEPIRNYFDMMIGISSGYRSKALNKAVKGSRTSHHCKGMALDIDGDIYGEVKNADIFNFVIEHLEFTQLIWEYGTDKEPAWVHVSYDPDNLKKQVLRKRKGEKYKNY